MLFNFIDTGQDMRTLEQLYKSLDTSGLVQKQVQVHGKNGKVFMRKQWVNPNQAVVNKTVMQTTNQSDSLVPVHQITELPDHIKNLKKPIPPNWTNVRISMNPDSKVHVIGTDSKGRNQYIYNETFVAEKQSEKFNRVSDMRHRMNEITEAIDLMEDRETADCLKLIAGMGIRPGSTIDTKSKVQAYGATTLKGRHVIEENGMVYLRFIGKKGVQQNHRVPNKELSDMLLKRKEAAGFDGDLFNTTATKLRVACKPLGVHPKDFRTLLATTTAAQELLNIEPAKDIKSFVKTRNVIGDVVSDILGNQRTVALSSYINESVFKNWCPDIYEQWKSSKEK